MTVDPGLAAALQKARKEHPGKSDAALVKELALRGSKASSEGQTNSALERILARPGVRLPSRKLEGVMPRLGQSRTLDSETIERLLEEERADRDIP